MIGPVTRFIQDTRASVTVEFVIIFPFIIMLILFILLASTLIATASDVQQLAYELARASIEILSTLGSGQDLCTRLNNEVLNELAQRSAMLSPDNVTRLAPCGGMPADGFVTITVNYQTAGSGIADLLDDFGMDITTITRSATIRP